MIEILKGKKLFILEYFMGYEFAIFQKSQKMARNNVYNENIPDEINLNN